MTATEQCPPDTEPSQLHLVGYPTGAVMVGGLLLFVVLAKTRGTLRVALGAVVVVVTLVGAFAALLVASFTAPCV